MQFVDNSVRTDCARPSDTTSNGLASNVNVARIAPSKTRGRLSMFNSTESSTVLPANCCKRVEHQVRLEVNKCIRRQFRGEIKPSKHRFEPSEQIRHTSLQVRLSEVASLYVSNAADICHMARSTAEGPYDTKKIALRRQTT